MFVSPSHEGAPSASGSPAAGEFQRYETVVIMASDEADRAVVGKKGDSPTSPSGGGGDALSHPHPLPSYHEHPASTLLPHHNYDDEFSVDHIDLWTLRFNHFDRSGGAAAANQAATHALSKAPSSTTSLADSTARPSSAVVRVVDVTLEQGFLSDFFTRYWRRVQNAILTATIIWALYVVNDIQKNQEGLRRNYHATLILRFVNCGIGLVCAAVLMTPFIQRRKLLMPVVGFAMITFGVAQIVFGLWDENELDPSYSVIMILLPSTSSTLFKQRFIFTVVFQAAMLLLYIIITYAFDSFHSTSDLVLTALGLLLANCLFAMHAYRREYKMRKDYLMKCQLEREELRSQNLLLRMLPASVISKLREGSDFIFYKHEEVTLLFAHIHDFEAHVHAMTPMQVIRMLNSLFTRFDLLCDEHGVYKVETIGDVYLVSSGCPIEYARADHADAIAAFALDMVGQAKMFLVEHVRDVKSGSVEVLDPKSKHYGRRKKHGTGHVSNLCPIQLRLGINTGGLISGVVGVKYPRFRLMGDTINTASRMSTTAQADQIQLSTRSWEAINNQWFETRYRGEIAVKGKGQMKTYLLLSKINLICPLPRSLIQVQRDNGTLAMDAFVDKNEAPGAAATAGKTHGGLLVDSPSQQQQQPNGRQGLGPRQSPVSTAAVHLQSSGRPSPLHTGSASNLNNGTAVIEMLPTELPGVPEMLQRLRSGEVAEELDEDHTEDERSRNSMSALSKREDSVPSRLDALDGNHLEDVLAANGGEGDILLVPDSKGHVHPEHVIRAGDTADGATPPTSPFGDHRSLRPSPVAKKRGLGVIVPTVANGHGSPFSGPATLPSGSPRTPFGSPGSGMVSASPGKSTRQRTTSGNDGAGGGVAVQPFLLSSATVRTGSTVSSTNVGGRSTGRLTSTASHDRLPSIGSLREHSTSSRSKSTSQSKMVITALDHQSTFKSVRLFSFGPMNAILKPSRRWWACLSQTFVTDPVLEYEYRHVYAKEYARTNIRTVNAMWLFLLPLSIYDVLNNTDLAPSRVAYSWLVRLAGLAVGVWFYRQSQKAEYPRYMQAATCATVSVVAIVYIYTTAITSALLKSYGVSFVLVILCLMCMFVGLRFHGAMIACSLTAIAWIIATLAFEGGTLPGIGSVLLAGGVMYLETCWNMEHESRHDFVRFRKLYHERMSTHAFLSNMLPPMVFEGLKREDAALVAHERPDASILFSDIVGFTSIAATLKPEDVVAILNVMFSNLDILAEKHHVYKVETIGDAYVACTNVIDQRADHARCLVEFALAMQKATKRMYTPSHQQIIIRVGLHTGSVVAGVVGRKMPRYHLFGESVTIAELMEQRGVPGMVAISHACFQAMPPGSCTVVTAAVGGLSPTHDGSGGGGGSANPPHSCEYECKPLDPVAHEDHTIKRYTVERAKGYQQQQHASSGATNGDANGGGATTTNKNRRASLRASGGAIGGPHRSGSNTNVHAAHPSTSSLGHVTKEALFIRTSAGHTAGSDADSPSPIQADAPPSPFIPGLLANAAASPSAGVASPSGVGASPGAFAVSVTATVASMEAPSRSASSLGGSNKNLGTAAAAPSPVVVASIAPPSPGLLARGQVSRVVGHARGDSIAYPLPTTVTLAAAATPTAQLAPKTPTRPAPVIWMPGQLDSEDITMPE